MQVLRERTEANRYARLRELRFAGVMRNDAFTRLEEELDPADLEVDSQGRGRRWAAWWRSHEAQTQKIGIQQPLDRYPFRFEILEGGYEQSCIVHSSGIRAPRRQPAARIIGFYRSR